MELDNKFETYSNINDYKSFTYYIIHADIVKVKFSQSVTDIVQIF